MVICSIDRAYQVPTTILVLYRLCRLEKSGSKVATSTKVWSNRPNVYIQKTRDQSRTAVACNHISKRVYKTRRGRGSPKHTTESSDSNTLFKLDSFRYCRKPLSWSECVTQTVRDRLEG